MDTPVPFPPTNSDPSSPQLASQIATENAQITVEMYKQQLENAQKQHEYNSAQLEKPSTNSMNSMEHRQHWLR